MAEILAAINLLLNLFPDLKFINLREQFTVIILGRAYITLLKMNDILI